MYTFCSVVLFQRCYLQHALVRKHFILWDKANFFLKKASNNAYSQFQEIPFVYQYERVFIKFIYYVGDAAKFLRKICSTQGSLITPQFRSRLSFEMSLISCPVTQA